MTQAQEPEKLYYITKVDLIETCVSEEEARAKLKELQGNFDDDCVYVCDELRTNYEAKYRKAIDVIKRIDAGLISMYDL